MRATAIVRSTRSVGEGTAADIVTTRPPFVVPRNGEPNRRASPVHLTARQLEVLGLLCEGLPNKLICRRLNISAGTVKAHISSILRELDVSSRLQAVVWARRCGLLADAGVPDHEQDADADKQQRDHESAGSGTSMAYLYRRALN